jgi:hypothetical protein
MNDNPMNYTPPALVAAGDFADITLGPTGGGFDHGWKCLAFCNPNGT